MIAIFEVIAKAQQALAIAQLLKPVLGDQADIVEDVTQIVGKVLVGAKFGAKSYEALVKQLDEVIAEMEAIKAKGGVKGSDIKAEVDAIRSRGTQIDLIMARLKK
jgi:hypothetical protein